MGTELNINQGLVETALEISKARRNTLLLAKEAVRRGDLKEADRLLTELVPDEELHRVAKGKHARASRRGSSVITFPTNR